MPARAPARRFPVALARWAAVALVAELVTLVVLITPVVSWRPRADEGHYLRYAMRIANDGVAGFPALLREYLDDPVGRAHFASPLRVTAIVPGAMAVRWGGPNFESLAALSLLAFLLLLAVVFAAMRPVVGTRAAFSTIVLLAASPLHLAMARRALTDSLNATLLVGSLALFIHALGGRAGRHAWPVVTLAYGLTFLAKEMNLILVPISLALLAWQGAWRRRWPEPWSVAAVSILPVAGAAAMASLAAGGPHLVWAAVTGTVLQPGGNPYSLAFGGGPWFRYVIDLVALSPLPTLLYVGWLGHLAATRSREEQLWAWALVPVLFVVCAAPFTKFVRWALLLETPIRLGAVMLLQRVVGDRGRWATLGMVALLGALVTADLVSFQRLFVAADIYDPTTASLLGERHLLPR